jgi:DNA polymerase phi
LFTNKEKENKEKDPEETTQDDLEPIDVLVDTLIGFLEKATSYMRTVANQAFFLLSGSVKESTVELILTVRRAPLCSTAFRLIICVAT